MLYIIWYVHVAFVRVLQPQTCSRSLTLCRKNTDWRQPDRNGCAPGYFLFVETMGLVAGRYTLQTKLQRTSLEHVGLTTAIQADHHPVVREGMY